ncbi:hypothetical protein HQQ94_08795 [Shewanella sp. VB17]|uniref:hypothetical protein n=1 Tax=Shewanella sp. VB17 TaxID=2739432 RepID=UPI001565E88D|nr:hypothetical protein [Shewanella sp. VB17]NRD73337.1 hypothetical protein [Shewanella sp. VB17]
MIELEKLNQSLTELLIFLDKEPAEHELADELVSKLLLLVDKRQVLLDRYLIKIKPEDKAMWLKELALTQDFEHRAKAIMLHRQELMHLSRKSKRQINVYKSIGDK